MRRLASHERKCRDLDRLSMPWVLLMDQWAASAVVIDGVSFSWPEAVSLLTSGKEIQAIEIVIAAAAFAQSAKDIDGSARENQYREVLGASERLLLTCRNAAVLIDDLDLRNAAVAQSKLNGGLLGKLRACVHRVIAADRLMREPEGPDPLERAERIKLALQSRDLESETAVVLIAEIFDLARRLYCALPERSAPA